MNEYQNKNAFRAKSVCDLIWSRKREGSVPGQRSDNRRLALVIEGGAMRGVVSAGMVAALEELALKDVFDVIYGSSAGAIAGAYFVAGQARYGTTIFYENINNNKFIDLRRLISGSPVVSLEYLLYDVCMYQKPLNSAAFFESPTPYRVLASSIEERRSVSFYNFSDLSELLLGLKASARIPIFAGGPVIFRGKPYLDAAIYESIPLAAAKAEHATDVLALLTRPRGLLRSKPGFVDSTIVAPMLRRYGSAFASDYMRRAESYSEEMQSLYDDSDEDFNVLVAQVSSQDPKVGSLEKRRAELVCGAKAGFNAIYRALGVPLPQLVEIIKPFSDLERHMI